MFFLLDAYFLNLVQQSLICLNFLVLVVCYIVSILVNLRFRPNTDWYVKTYAHLINNSWHWSPITMESLYCNHFLHMFSKAFLPKWRLSLQQTIEKMCFNSCLFYHNIVRITHIIAIFFTKFTTIFTEIFLRCTKDTDRLMKKVLNDFISVLQLHNISNRKASHMINQM